QICPIKNRGTLQKKISSNQRTWNIPTPLFGCLVFFPLSSKPNQKQIKYPTIFSVEINLPMCKSPEKSSLSPAIEELPKHVKKNELRKINRELKQIATEIKESLDTLQDQVNQVTEFFILSRLDTMTIRNMPWILKNKRKKLQDDFD